MLICIYVSKSNVPETFSGATISEAPVRSFFFPPGLVGTPLPTTPSTVGNSAVKECNIQSTDL